jgi:hypothetical protein
VSKQVRRQDTPRKILVEAIMFAKLERGELDKKKFRGMLDRALTRANLRALFDLPETSEVPQTR